MKSRPRKGFRGIGEPVVYDPEAHRDFVTGFRKRKQARRLEARANAEKVAKEERRQLRKEKREFIREQREQLDPSGVGSGGEDDDDIDEQDPDATVQHFENSDGALVTTVVAPLDAPFPLPAKNSQHSDEEIDANDDTGDNSTNQQAGNRLADNSETVSEGCSSKVPPSSASKGVAGKALLKASAPIRKSKWQRRHISYTHAHHKRRAKSKAKGRSTHSERRKRQGKGGKSD